MDKITEHYVCNENGELVSVKTKVYESIEDACFYLLKDTPELAKEAHIEIGLLKSTTYWKEQPDGGYEESEDMDMVKLSDYDSVIISKNDALNGYYDNDIHFEENVHPLRRFILQTKDGEIELYLSWIYRREDDEDKGFVPVVFTSYLVEQGDIPLLYAEMNNDYKFNKVGHGSSADIRLITDQSCFYGYSLGGYLLLYASTWT